MTSSPAITPSIDGDKTSRFGDQQSPQDEDEGKGFNVIRPIDLSKIIDVETHNAEKHGKYSASL